MNLLNPKNIAFITVLLFASSQFCLAQEGNLSINQDQKIDKLLTIKKEMNTSETDSERYKIQIYSGNRAGAEKAKTKINSKMSDLPSILEFETPNYKIWVGNFRNKLEADRTLLKVQNEFPNAFVFKPKKDKE